MSSYGVTSTGFVPKQQTQIIDEINGDVTAAFGANVNLGGETALGVLIGIFSEREALLWQLGEAIYQSAFPAGAEGVSVDNILALSGLSRLPATATVTDPTPSINTYGITLYGLVLFGTPGKTVPQGSFISTNDAQHLNFTLNAPVTIQAAVNAVQTVVLSAAPTSGVFDLVFTRVSDGFVFTTSDIPAGATASQVQSAIAALTDGTVFPYTDVVVTQSGNNYVLSFGAQAPSSGQPSSGAQAQPLVGIVNNALMNGTLVVNMATVQTTPGAPAQGVGSATCTVTGPYVVPAGDLTIIGSPTSGWTGVTNQLDCTTGSNIESDTAALNRRLNRLSQQGNGTLAAIEARVAAVTNVTAVQGFENLTGCAVQTLTFGAIPSAGTYQLALQQGVTTAIPYNATAAAVQTAINAIAGYNVIVTGNTQYGMAIDYNGSFGGQPQLLMTIQTNTTGVSITPSFGRPGHAFEMVVAGGANADIAAAIQSAQPAGISSYGAPTAIVTGSTTAGNAILSVNSVAGIQAGNLVTGPGILPGTTILQVGSSTVTMNQAAAVSFASQQYTFTNAVVVLDSQKNSQTISFSRYVQVLPYVAVALLTDYYVQPGVPASGINTQAKFLPSSIPTLQQDIVAIGNATAPGGLIVGQGTNGIVGAFNAIPGIISYGVAIQLGTAPSMPSATAPSVPANIQLLPEQSALFEAINVAVSWS